MKLWYREAAKKWMEALPVGNGMLGGMDFGGAASQRIGLNHSWLWRSKNLEGLSSPQTASNLAEVRRLFFEDKPKEGAEAVNRLLGSLGDVLTGRGGVIGPDPYQPAGDLQVRFDGHEKCEDYRRELDLSSGISRVSYVFEGVKYEREALVSRNEGVILVHLKADAAGKISFEAELSRIEDPNCKIEAWAEGEVAGFSGEFTEKLRFASAMGVWQRGGKNKTSAKGDKGFARISGADEAVIVVDIATDHDSNNPRQSCIEKVKVVLKGFDSESVIASSVAEYQKMFGRVELELGGEDLDVATNERLAAYRGGASDNKLEAMYFQYGRYLLISSSAKGGMPANLQGIWNEEIMPAWSSDIHTDINVQMNYWPAEMGNIAECCEPFFDYFDRCIPNAQTAARNIYGCRGIFIPISDDAWCRCLKTAVGWDEWIGAAGWVAQHYWRRYEFGGDRKFLADRAYPFMKEAALFYEDYLVKDPRSESRHYGKLVTVPSQSPENQFVGGSEPVSLCIGATMDFEIIYDLLTHLIKASEILDVDKEQRRKWKDILKNIPELQVGKHGQLQEWLEDYDEVEPDHRHLSPLFGLFPGEHISKEVTPKFAKAAEVTLQRRLGKGGWAGSSNNVGWSLMWMGHLWGRLENSEKVYENLREMLGRLTSDNLFSFFKTFFQIDANFGATSCIAHTLLDSGYGRLHLLPSVPKEWPAGYVRGLVGRGGFEVDIEWENSRLKKARVVSRLGNRCRLRTNEPVRVSCKGKSAVTKQAGENVIEFETEKGAAYDVSV